MRLAFSHIAFRAAPLRVFSRAPYTCRTRPAVFSTAPRMAMSGTPTGEDTVQSAIEGKITATLSPSRLVVVPKHGDPNGSHVTIEVVSEAFEGLSMMKRHQAVYKAIWEELSVCCIRPQ